MAPQKDSEDISMARIGRLESRFDGYVQVAQEWREDIIEARATTREILRQQSDTLAEIWTLIRGKNGSDSVLIKLGKVLSELVEVSKRQDRIEAKLDKADTDIAHYPLKHNWVSVAKMIVTQVAPILTALATLLVVLMKK
jgi:hypothetical protein